MLDALVAKNSSKILALALMKYREQPRYQSKELFNLVAKMCPIIILKMKQTMGSKNNVKCTLEQCK